MTLPGGFTRRDVLMKIGILLNGIVAAVLAVPIVRYLLSPVARGRKGGYESWVPLGNLEQFPSGQTRLATYRNPVVNPTDGDTADIACWVRNVDGQNFPGLRDQLRAPRMSRPLVPAIEPVYVPMSWWRLLSRRIARFRPSRTRIVRISLQDRKRTSS